MHKLKILGIILSIFILIAMNFFPTSELLTESGRNTIAIMLVIIILLTTEPIPIGVTCLLTIVLLMVSKAAPDLNSALSGFTNHIVFFVLVSFGISAAITKVPLSTRLLKKLMIHFGKNVNLMILSIMLCSAIVSSMVSNVASTAVFIPIVLGFLNIYKNEQDRKKTGKAIMIGLPVGSMIGGMLTPAGSSLNLMVINLFEQVAGIKITFIQWMVFGVPAVSILLPIAWFIIVKVYKPVELTKAEIHGYIEELDVPSSFSSKEKYVFTLIIGLLFFWILGSWIPVFNVTIVAIVGFSLLFLPKIEILTWEEFAKSVNWAAFLLVGMMISIGNNLVANGVSDWIVSTILPSSLNIPIFGVVFVIALIIFLMLIVVPVAPALITILLAPLVGLAANIGINPILIIMTLGLCVSNCYLIPLDTVPLLTYMTGYYKMIEMPRATAIIQLIVALVVAIWIPIASTLLKIHI